MSQLAAACAVVAALFGGLASAQANVVVTVDKSAQQLSVIVDGVQRYQWPVSTARMGYRTPNGTYRPQWLARKWYSREYDWSPMPYSIFFNEGYAIHGSYEVSRLGRPASHGCIRLHPENAALLFALVKDHMDDTTIVVTGERPAQIRTRDEDEHKARHHTHRETHRSRQAAPQDATAFGHDPWRNSWHNNSWHQDGRHDFFFFGPPPAR